MVEAVVVVSHKYKRNMVFPVTKSSFIEGGDQVGSNIRNFVFQGPQDDLGVDKR